MPPSSPSHWLHQLVEEMDIRATSCWLLVASGTMALASVVDTSCFRAASLCFTLSVTFVGSIYIWKLEHTRRANKGLTSDHASIIKRRFASIAAASLASTATFVVYWCARPAHDDNPFLSQASVREALGLRLGGAFRAIVLPLFLTMVLFGGPLLLNICDGLCSLYMDFRYWRSNFKNFVWLRNHVMAPLTEEYTFRACMMPILVPCFGVKTSVIVCPLFFGVAHVHHVVEKLHRGIALRHALFAAAFQFGYTTIFGMYSAFLFVRTGTFIAPLVAHAFCNHMGFPNFSDLFAYKQPMRTLLGSAYIAGIVAWYYLLFPLTEPRLYDNRLWVWD